MMKILLGRVKRKQFSWKKMIIFMEEDD